MPPSVLNNAFDSHGPGQSIAEVLSSYRELQQGGSAATAGALSLPAFRLDDLREARCVLRDEGDLRISLYFPGGVRGVQPSLALLRTLPGFRLDSVVVTVDDVSIGPIARALKDVVPETAKPFVRTGRAGGGVVFADLMGSGVGAVLDTAEGIAPPLAVAESICTATHTGTELTVVTTSHVISSRDPERGHHKYGVLNLLCAVDDALDAANSVEVAETLVVQRGLATRVRSFDPERSAAIRRCIQRFTPTNTLHTLAELAALRLADTP